MSELLRSSLIIVGAGVLWWALASICVLIFTRPLSRKRAR